MISLVNATYDTFNDVPDGLDGVPPEEYLKYVMSLRSELTYFVVSNSEDSVYSTELVSTVTESGSCFSYNSEVSFYSNYKSANRLYKYYCSYEQLNVTKTSKRNVSFSGTGRTATRL